MNSKCEHCTCTTVCCPARGECFDGGDKEAEEEDLSVESLPLLRKEEISFDVAVVLVVDAFCCRCDCCTSATWMIKLGGNLELCAAALHVSVLSL